MLTAFLEYSFSSASVRASTKRRRKFGSAIRCWWVPSIKGYSLAVQGEEKAWIECKKVVRKDERTMDACVSHAMNNRFRSTSISLGKSCELSAQVER